MKALVLPLALVMAAGATAAMVWLMLRDESASGAATAAEQQAGTPAENGRAATAPPPGVRVLRPWQTAATLVEDLRDGLVPPANGIELICARVSQALRPKARWALLKLAPRVASPRVRALVVFAAGVHVPDDVLLREAMRDRDPTVRQAAIIAAGRRADGKSSLTVAAAFSVPVGRLPGPQTEAALRLARQDDDVRVRAAARTVLQAAGYRLAPQTQASPQGGG